MRSDWQPKRGLALRNAGVLLRNAAVCSRAWLHTVHALPGALIRLPVFAWIVKAYESIVKVMQLRESLRPYVKMVMAEANRTGVPALRPL